MKFKLSLRLLRKILITTTIFNGFLLFTYVFHIITLTVNETYMLFVLSIPAFLFSKSWLLLIGLFGFEGLLLIYYWQKTKSKSAAATTTTISPQMRENNFSELVDFDEEILATDIAVAEVEERAQEEEQRNPKNEPLATPYPQQKTIEAITPEDNRVELEFDKLWEEAIEHVRNAPLKKKAGLSQQEPKRHEKEAKHPPTPTESSQREPFNSIAPPFSPIQENPLSRAVIRKEKLKQKRGLYDPSIIREEHREFFNEIALNNWIYQNSQVRKRVGLYKTALNETRFQEVDIQYLIDARVLFKLLIPFPTGAFIVYSINETEDKKIIRSYLAKLCKQHNCRLQQKSVTFVNYTELGLDRKTWRFDFSLNKQALGVIWLSNFLIVDDFGTNYALTFQHKKELKALFAATQILSKEGEKLVPIIITDYRYNKAIIQKYLEQQGFGSAIILTVGEKQFVEEFTLLIKGANPLKPKNL